LLPQNLPTIPYDFSSDYFSLKTSLQPSSDKFRLITISTHQQKVHFIADEHLIEGFRFSDMEIHDNLPLELLEFDNMKEE
jgi:hypothetical protein